MRQLQDEAKKASRQALHARAGAAEAVTLGVYREERRAVETGCMKGGGEERRHEPHTWGSPKWPCR